MSLYFLIRFRFFYFFLFLHKYIDLDGVIMFTVKIQMYNSQTFATEDDDVSFLKIAAGYPDVFPTVLCVILMKHSKVLLRRI